MYASMEEFFEALRRVETGNMPNNGIAAIGDNNSALGPLQIHYCYFADAIEYAEKNHLVMDMLYQQCAYWLPSKIVAYLYFQRYAPTALREGDWVKLARIHNGGPRGYRKKATEGYAEKFKKELQKVVNKRLLKE